jgi:hypothetical protein
VLRNARQRSDNRASFQNSSDVPHAGTPTAEQDYGFSALDAYELLSQVAKIHLNEMVDPNYVVVASIEKKFLPPKKK